MKFGVLKISDVEKYCSEESKRALDKVVLEIFNGRINDGKSVEDKYLVINSKESYFKEVKQIIEKHEGEKVKFE